MNIHHISIYQKGPHLKSRHSFHLYIIYKNPFTFIIVIMKIRLQVIGVQRANMGYFVHIYIVNH